MKSKIFLVVMLALFAWHASAQIRLDGVAAANIDPRLFAGRWNAHWIALPDAPANTFGVHHFRKTFTLDTVPERFIVHVSADSRYKLYVNGHLASIGPACGDVLNWNFETVDLFPYLSEGENTLAAVVWNFADNRPLAQTSFGKTAFIVQGNTPAEEVVNTDSSWLCTANTAYAPHNNPVLGYYAAGACERLDASAYPWGWKLPGYDDSQWTPAHGIIQGAVKGARDYPGWQLVPRPIPQMEMRRVRIPAVRRVEGVETVEGFPLSGGGFTVPAHTQAEILLDNERLITGYPTITFSGGRDAEITIGYAESLYENVETGAKGDRNAVEGKTFIGYEDVIVADGGRGRSFMPLWWRTWRYIRIAVKTGDELLTVDDVFAVTSMYPFERESVFHAPGYAWLDDILDTGWHTARLCANETYMDCPYYEQLQYLGDTRIQSMVTLYNTCDDRLVRNALEQGRRSIVPDGITMSRYPSSLHQFIPSFSLWWICSAHDYWRYRGGEEYLKTLLPAWRGILSWYEQYLKPDHSLGRIPYWFFVDWCGTPGGEPIREENGNSAVQDLQYALALEAASGMERAFGLPVMADHYERLADSVKSSFARKYWDADRGLFSDTHDHRSFSQHANVLAILAGLTRGEESAALFDRLTADTTLIRCTIYFRYYLQQAMKAAGKGDALLDNLQVWKDQLALGLTTWAERPEPSRSDCHAWGASPNIELFRMVLGIDSDAPGFARVRIEPSLCGLREVSGSIPHPSGSVSVDYRLSGKGELTARITLPEGVGGVFVWNDREYPLSEGIGLHGEINALKIEVKSCR